MLNLLIGILATWRLASFFANGERGPFGLFDRLRSLAGVKDHQPTTELAKGLTCFWCCSVWGGSLVALAFADNVLSWALLTLAHSAGAIAINETLAE